MIQIRNSACLSLHTSKTNAFHTVRITPAIYREIFSDYLKNAVNVRNLKIKNNRNLRIKTGPVTAGADATVNVWFHGPDICVNKAGHKPLYPVQP